MTRMPNKKSIKNDRDVTITIFSENNAILCYSKKTTSLRQNQDQSSHEDMQHKRKKYGFFRGSLEHHN